MDNPSSVMTPAEGIGVVVAFVAAVRKASPKLDGWPVLAISVAFGIALSFVTADVIAVRIDVVQGIVMGLTASGGMAALKYHAMKSGETAAVVAASIRPPPGGTVAPVSYDIKAPLVVLCLVATVFLTGACSAVCPVIHAVDTACPYVVILFEDGHTEKYLRSDIVAGARMAAGGK